MKFNDPYDSASFFLTEKAFEHMPYNVETDHMSEDQKKRHTRIGQELGDH
jgi:hypothetical protein